MARLAGKEILRDEILPEKSSFSPSETPSLELESEIKSETVELAVEISEKVEITERSTPKIVETVEISQPATATTMTTTTTGVDGVEEIINETLNNNNFKSKVEYPFLAFLASGGHTSILLCKKLGNKKKVMYEVVGGTFFLFIPLFIYSFFPLSLSPPPPHTHTHTQFLSISHTLTHTLFHPHALNILLLSIFH